MKLRKMIHNEILYTIISIVLINALLISFSYAYFFQIDEGTSNEVKFGNLSLTLCKSEECNTTNDQIGNIIGLTTINNTRVPEKIFPKKDEDALTEEPYRFIIKNDGDYDLYVQVSLKPDDTFNIKKIYENTEYSEYKETDYSNIKVAINEKGNSPTIKKYNELNDSIIANNILLEKGTSKVYELRVWESENSSNTSIGTYFVTNINLEGEYLIDE